MADLIGWMETALAAFSSGRVAQPVRTVLEMGEAAFFGVMPGYLRDSRVLGAKLVAVVEANARRGMPTHRACIVLHDGETGAPAALLDGRLITEMRTAAVSAVSVRRLARAEASVLAILGSGVQARSHLAALSLVRDFREVRAWSPTAANLARFAAQSAGRVDACDSAEEAVRGSDVIVLATASTAPVVDNDWVADGAHVVSVGACRPSHREMDPKLVARARLMVDSKDAAFRESGDVILGMRDGLFGPDHVAAELGEVIAGRVAGRTSPEQVTVFKSLGLAVEDLAAADLAYRRARERGMGVTVDLGG